jgi:hypothetical protein
MIGYDSSSARVRPLRQPEMLPESLQNEAAPAASFLAQGLRRCRSFSGGPPGQRALGGTQRAIGIDVAAQVSLLGSLDDGPQPLDEARALVAADSVVLRVVTQQPPRQVADTAR